VMMACEGNRYSSPSTPPPDVCPVGVSAVRMPLSK
jgi:hypothetical protein